MGWALVSNLQVKADPWAEQKGFWIVSVAAVLIPAED